VYHECKVTIPRQNKTKIFDVGRAGGEGGGVTPRKIGRGVRPASPNPYPIHDQDGGKMAKIDTLFMTKTAEKPYPLGPHIPI